MSLAKKQGGIVLFERGYLNKDTITKRKQDILKRIDARIAKMRAEQSSGARAQASR